LASLERGLPSPLTILGEFAKFAAMESGRDETPESRFEPHAQLLRALAHPSRLFILEELHRGERCVQELTEMIGADMSTVSKHISVLKSVGLVQGEKRGTFTYYRLRTDCVTEVFACVDESLEAAKEDGD
jgi:ArsR family transcriptional regulator